MGKREDAMQRREELAAETLAAREGARELREAGFGLPAGWIARLHPRDRRGKFRETMHPERFKDPSAPHISAMTDEQLSALQKHHLSQQDGPMVAEVGSEMGRRYRASRWQPSHAGGGGIKDTQGHYVHGWAGKLESGRYSASLTDKTGATAQGEGHTPQAAAEAAHQVHLAGKATQSLPRRVARRRP